MVNLPSMIELAGHGHDLGWVFQRLERPHSPHSFECGSKRCCDKYQMVSQKCVSWFPINVALIRDDPWWERGRSLLHRFGHAIYSWSFFGKISWTWSCVSAVGENARGRLSGTAFRRRNDLSPGTFPHISPIICCSWIFGPHSPLSTRVRCECGISIAW